MLTVLITQCFYNANQAEEGACRISRAILSTFISEPVVRMESEPPAVRKCVKTRDGKLIPRSALPVSR